MRSWGEHPTIFALETHSTTTEKEARNPAETYEHNLHERILEEVLQQRRLREKRYCNATMRLHRDD
jgi:hypothetical protein